MTHQSDIKVTKSNGLGKGGKTFYYIRPLTECHNRSRKVSGFTHQEIQEKIEKVITKWYSPIVVLYEVDGHIIGSNSKENALKEYWRICELADAKAKKMFDVKVLTNPTGELK